MDIRILNYDEYVSACEEKRMPHILPEADMMEQIQEEVKEYADSCLDIPNGLVLPVAGSVDYNVYLGCIWTEEQVLEIEFCRLEG